MIIKIIPFIGLFILDDILKSLENLINFCLEKIE